MLKPFSPPPPAPGLDYFTQRRKNSLAASRLREDLDDEEFDINNAPLRRSTAGYGLKTDDLLAKQKYDDTMYSNDPSRVSRRRALEDSMMQVREGILGKMKRSF